MKRILVIEDDAFMARAISLILTRQGHEVTLAAGSTEALHQFNQHHFDLILTDIMLPFSSGLDLINEFKQRETDRETPVIVVSSVTNEKTMQYAFYLGADDYLKKPFTPGELVSRANRLMRRA